MAQVIHNPSDLGNDEAILKGKEIQEHLESINMDAWYYIYQIYVNPQNRK